MSTTTTDSRAAEDAAQTTTVKVFRVYISASPEAIWEAITSPEWTAKYGYRGPATYDLRPGGGYHAAATPEMVEHGAPETVVEGEVLESDPPRKLVQTWRMLFSPEMAAEPKTTLTWEIEAESDTLTRLTVTHDVTGAPMHEGSISPSPLKLVEGGGGWSWILSDLKSLLETGKALEM